MTCRRTRGPETDAGNFGSCKLPYGLLYCALVPTWPGNLDVHIQLERAVLVGEQQHIGAKDHKQVYQLLAVTLAAWPPFVTSSTDSRTLCGRAVSGRVPTRSCPVLQLLSPTLSCYSSCLSVSAIRTAYLGGCNTCSKWLVTKSLSIITLLSFAALRRAAAMAAATLFCDHEMAQEMRGIRPVPPPEHIFVKPDRRVAEQLGLISVCLWPGDHIQHDRVLVQAGEGILMTLPSSCLLSARGMGRRPVASLIKRPLAPTSRNAFAYSALSSGTRRPPRSAMLAL